METSETPVEIIKELIQLHKDRVVLYHQAVLAMQHPDRVDLKMIIGEIIQESIEFQQELANGIARLNGRTNGEDKEHKGAIYRIWEKAKPSIGGTNSKSILETCRQESEAVRQAYQAVLSTPYLIDDVLRLRLKMQMVVLTDIEDKIRGYHDAL
jgi:uncharacterized protein (TIGR02284 family)